MGAQIVCLSFELYGTGSDKDRSFERGGYFKGPVWITKEKDIYTGLFKRKGARG